MATTRITIITPEGSYTTTEEEEASVIAFRVRRLGIRYGHPAMPIQFRVKTQRVVSYTKNRVILSTA